MTNKTFNKLLTEVSVPVLAELLVFLVFLDKGRFGVFLDKPEEDPRGPLFGVEVEKLGSTFGLRLTNIVVELGILQADNQPNQVHPLDNQILDCIVDFVVNGFPNEFDHQVNQLRISVSLTQQVKIRQNSLQKCEKVIPFFLSNRKLKRSRNRNQNMHHGHQVFISPNFGQDRLYREPGFVLMTDDGADDFFVKFDKFVAFGASDHRDDDDFFDL